MKAQILNFTADEINNKLTNIPTVAFVEIDDLPNPETQETDGILYFVYEQEQK